LSEKSRFERVATSVPINGTARTVTESDGSHWTPQLSPGTIIFDAPPPMLRALPPNTPNLIGLDTGRLRVVGIWADMSKGLRWICRCACGKYVPHRARTLIRKKERSSDTELMCDACYALERIKRLAGNSHTARDFRQNVTLVESLPTLDKSEQVHAAPLTTLTAAERRRRIEWASGVARSQLPVLRMRGDGNTASIRRRLFDADNRCYWCGRETDWINPGDGRLPDHAATVDHLVSKYRRAVDDPCDVVLACSGCNQRRSQLETAALPHEEKIARSNAVQRFVEARVATQLTGTAKESIGSIMATRPRAVGPTDDIFDCPLCDRSRLRGREAFWRHVSDRHSPQELLDAVAVSKPAEAPQPPPESAARPTQRRIHLRFKPASTNGVCAVRAGALLTDDRGKVTCLACMNALKRSEAADEQRETYLSGRSTAETFRETVERDAN
jgi:hypothetical protein